MKKSRLQSAVLAVVFAFCCCCTFSATANAEKGYINNANLMPKYVTDDKVTLEDSGNGLMSPDWVKTLIVEEVNVAKASPNGKFSGMTYVLDHLQEMGVNGIWLDPIYDGKHYRNYGPHTVSTYLTGTLDYEAGWKVVKNFVDEAHKRNIRVFLDIVTWGTSDLSSLYTEHPDWYIGINEEYGGPQFDWKNEALFNWFLETMKGIVRKTGVDGFRADCGVEYCGAELYKRIRNDLLNEGKKIALIGESVEEENLGTFDFEEHSVNLETGQIWDTGKFFTEMYNIVETVKTGRGIGALSEQKNGSSGQRRFYSALVSCHDAQNYIADGNLVTIGYASILTPFIPMWYIGEEWTNHYTSTKGWIYSTSVNWNLVDSNRDYYEKVKALIRIRRTYPEFFEYFPKNHRNTNICAVKTDHVLGLTGYARYADGKAVIVVPNYAEYNDRFEVTVPYSDMNLRANGQYKITNLLTNKVIAAGKASDLKGFEVSIPVKNIGVYLVENATASDLKNYGVKVPNLPQDNTLSQDASSEENISEVSGDAQGSSKQQKKENKTAAKADKGDSQLLLWCLLGGAVLLSAAGVGAVLYVRKRKKR